MGFLKRGCTRSVLKYTGTEPEVMELFTIDRMLGTTVDITSFRSQVGITSTVSYSIKEGLKGYFLKGARESNRQSSCFKYLLIRNAVMVLDTVNLGSNIFFNYFL